jgi:Zn ribbon nucleic-acid-binding protein
MPCPRCGHLLLEEQTWTVEGRLVQARCVLCGYYARGQAEDVYGQFERERKETICDR